MSTMKILELGCGTGESLIESARAHPDWDHLGIDRLPRVIETATRNAEGLGNIRFVAGDAAAWLDRLDPVDEIRILHPQPYGTPAERILTPAFFERAWRALRPGGALWLQTDHRAYWRYLLVAVDRHFEPEILSGAWKTRREAVARRKGMTVRRMIARRRDAPLEGETPALPRFRRGRVSGSK